MAVRRGSRRAGELDLTRSGLERRRRRSQRSDLGARVIVALPWVVLAVVAISLSKVTFALLVLVLGWLAMHELYTLMAPARPLNLAGLLALIGLVLAALLGRREQVLLAFVASFPLAYFVAVIRRRRERVAWGLAVTYLGIAWIGLAIAFAVLLRGRPHGAALIIDTLIGTFIGDTVAYAVGRSWGRIPLAPRISPNKTFEGLLGGIVGGTLAFWAFAAAYQDWFRGTDALLIGLAVSVAAPIGDLFESLVKRDIGVKDTGRFFGVHGGVLDRLDAVIFTLVTAYWVSLAVL